MEEDGPSFPVAVSLEVFLAFMVFLAVVIAVVLWAQSRRERKERTNYLAQYEMAELRMSPTKIGLVYWVVSKDGNQLRVVPIWDKKQPILKGSEIDLPEDALIPFDPTRFFG